jgi:hypothetical protein
MVRIPVNRFGDNPHFRNPSETPDLMHDITTMEGYEHIQQILARVATGNAATTKRIPISHVKLV